jgi:hypothetical protein
MLFNADHVELFKNHIDVFTSSIPDQTAKKGLKQTFLNKENRRINICGYSI